MCNAFTPNMRNFDEKPYTPDEQRVAKYLVELTKGTIGAGDDPIGFLIASHASLSALNVEAQLKAKYPDHESNSGLDGSTWS